jgi:DNA-binding SARP family transcriptional activator
MSSAPLPGHDIFIQPLDATAAVTPTALVRHGLTCIERGLYAEGAVFFALVSERLAVSQGPLLATLDGLRGAIAGYLHAQDGLLEASKRLAEAEAEQQARLASLKTLLPSLAETERAVRTLPASPSPSLPRREGRATQPLRLVRADEIAGEQETIDVRACLVGETSDCGERTVEVGKARMVSGSAQTLPDLYISCFGRFEVRRDDAGSAPLDLCSNTKGQAILRYLLTRPQRRASVDKLMAALWPDEEPEAARHKLRVAVSALRVSLNRDLVDRPGGGYILCKGQVYSLNPEVALHSDIDEFLALYHAGQAADGYETMALYERACKLYKGPFLPEDLYAEWSFITREELTKIYLTMCYALTESALANGNYHVAIQWATAILKVDRCEEQAHRQLMRAYAALKRRSEALRQYQLCQQILRDELGVPPMPETQRLLQTLLQG